MCRAAFAGDPAVSRPVFAAIRRTPEFDAKHVVYEDDVIDDVQSTVTFARWRLVGQPESRKGAPRNLDAMLSEGS